MDSIEQQKERGYENDERIIEFLRRGNEDHEKYEDFSIFYITFLFQPTVLLNLI